MAPKTSSHDQNTMFLYLCLQNAEAKTINWPAVASALDLNIPAARMRYTRLKKQLDASMADGKPILKGAPKEKEGDAEMEDESLAEASPTKKKKVTKRKRAGEASAVKEEGDPEEEKIVVKKEEGYNGDDDEE